MCIIPEQGLDSFDTTGTRLGLVEVWLVLVPRKPEDLVNQRLNVRVDVTFPGFQAQSVWLDIL